MAKQPKQLNMFENYIINQIRMRTYYAPDFWEQQAAFSKEHNT